MCIPISTFELTNATMMDLTQTSTKIPQMIKLIPRPIIEMTINRGYQPQMHFNDKTDWYVVYFCHFLLCINIEN